jgi:predicted ATP-binding protein involved in virulence
MSEVTITLRNYRCFEDTEPAEICIGPGFTALVGPNNAGKSTLVRLFYEIRQVLGLVGRDLLSLRGEVINAPYRAFSIQWKSTAITTTEI